MKKESFILFHLFQFNNKKYFIPFFRSIVVIRTCLSFWTRLLLARLCTIDFRMIFEFFPPMAFLAILFIWTTYFILCYKGIWIPTFAAIRIIAEFYRVWFSTIILPVVSVNTHASIVVDVVERAPNSFIVKDVEIHIILIIVY